MKLADERRKMADDLLKMEKQAELDVQVAEGRAAATAKHRKGGSGKGRTGSGRSGRALSNTESDNLSRIHKDYVENGVFEGQAPTLGEFEAQVERVLPEAGSLSQAAEMARGMWGSEEVTSTELKERHALSPARIWDDDGKYEETSTDVRYGFKGALGGDAPGNTPATPPTQTQPFGAAAASPAPATDGPDPAQVLADAKAAIERGADREAVKARLREMGIEAEGL
ncbi:hypothetical protein [Leisingera sp. M523]|uniref:hypothetical protein n=1 Tax=Leisingera sp. M523 TaxID=2867013 RepID=UPI0021A67A7A|nr:hypothetical protein [Leisingera sp. M523]UWQ30270.1 hypothetical protein K3557_06955 [Leisingera sp. M523]